MATQKLAHHLLPVGPQQAFTMLGISVGRHLTCSGDAIGHIWHLSALECLETMQPGVPLAAGEVWTWREPMVLPGTNLS